MNRRLPRKLKLEGAIERLAAVELRRLIHPRDIELWTLSPASYLQRRKDGAVTAVFIWNGAMTGARLCATVRRLQVEAS